MAVWREVTVPLDSSAVRFQGTFAPCHPPEVHKGAGLSLLCRALGSVVFPTSVHEIQHPWTLAWGLLLHQTTRGYRLPSLSKYSASGLVKATLASLEGSPWALWMDPDHHWVPEVAIICGLWGQLAQVSSVTHIQPTIWPTLLLVSLENGSQVWEGESMFFKGHEQCSDDLSQVQEPSHTSTMQGTRDVLRGFRGPAFKEVKCCYRKYRFIPVSKDRACA